MKYLKKELVNSLLFIAIFQLISCQPVQTDDIDINLEIISLQISELKSTVQPVGDFYPESLHFEFIIENKTGKNLLIGSNTKYHYSNSEYLSDNHEGIIGKFILINGSDSILLYTNSRTILRPNEHAAIWGSIYDNFISDVDTVFNNFIYKFPTEKYASLEDIYIYLQNSVFWYIPVKEDNEKILKKSISDKSFNDLELIYPQQPIKIRTKEPIVLLFGDYENYPNKYGIYRGDKESIVYKSE